MRSETKMVLVVAVLAVACSERSGGHGGDAGARDAGPMIEEDGGPPPTPDAGDVTDARDETDASADAEAPDAGPMALCAPRPPGDQPFRPPPGSEGILSESGFCIVLDGSRIRLLGLDSGAMVDGAIVRDASSYGNASLAWAGGSLYACSGSGFDGRIVKVTIDDGHSVDLDGECGAVTAYGRGLLVMPPLGSGGGGLAGYATEGAAVDRTPDEMFSVSYFGSRLGARADRAVAAWHSTAEVDLIDLVPGPGTATRLLLVGFDDWVDGIDMLDDGSLVIATRAGAAGGGERILIFDASGRLGRALSPAGLGLVNGLACASGAPPAPIAPGIAHRPVGPPAAGLACAGLEDYAASLDNAHGPSMSNGSCTGEGTPSNYLSYCDQIDPGMTEELHVVGLYEGIYPPGVGRGHWDCTGTDCVYVEPSGPGIADVTVRARPVPIILALTSYEAVTWTVTVEPGATIDRVIVADYPGDGLTSDVVGLPAGTTVERLDSTTLCGIAYGWEAIHNTGGGDYRLLISALRSRTGVVETTFQGCYAGGSFVVPHV
jgi:hypothetical protein